MISPFGAVTGRNTPSNSQFIFGLNSWLRGLIKPLPGYGLALIDWSAQEFGIAAVLSSDPALLAAYESGDPHLAFGIQAGIVPPDATKQTHPAERNLCKKCVHAINYGQGPEGLAAEINRPVGVARDLIRAHARTYPKFRTWLDGVVHSAQLTGRIHTQLGWQLHNAAYRTLLNFPMQSTGAELMQLASCLATERGLEVCCPIHDAFLLHAPLDRLEADAAALQACMDEASRTLLRGFTLRTGVLFVRSPDRFRDEDDKEGTATWDLMLTLLNGLTDENERVPSQGGTAS
jgi:DNA polymerase I-like protein with 3'-5' exonuclease and polymerase domains